MRRAIELDVGVIVLDAKRDVLEEDRLAGLGWCDDQATRAESERAEHVDQPTRWWAAFVFEP